MADTPTTLSARDYAHAREDWPQSALLSGFIATFCLTAVISGAYLFADRAGDATGGTIARWLFGLANNATTDRATDTFFLALGINLCIGLVLAIVYAALVEPRLGGPGWRTGMLFALIPFLLSIVVLFPLTDIGIFGVDANAGPLPVLGSLVAHLVYGAVLGGFYAIRIDEWDDASDHDRQAAHSANRGSARGLAVGIPIGVAMGFLMSSLLDSTVGAVAIIVAFALLGGAGGMLVGSFLGMSDGGSGHSPAAAPAPADDA